MLPSTLSWMRVPGRALTLGMPPIHHRTGTSPTPPNSLAKQSTYTRPTPNLNQIQSKESLRSPHALLPVPIDDLRNLPPHLPRIHTSPSHAHIDLLITLDHQQPLQQQVPHHVAHKHAAIHAVFLGRAVLELDEPERLLRLEQL